MSSQSGQDELPPETQVLFTNIIDCPHNATRRKQILNAPTLTTTQRQRLRQHILVDELLSQALAPERSAEAFLVGLIQRQRCEQDGETFTGRVLEQIEARGALRLRKTGRFLLEVAGFSAAALLVLGACLGLGELISLPHPSASPSISQVPRPIDLNAALAVSAKELE